MSVRVLIADDQAVVRSGLRRIMDVDAEIEVVGEAANGVEALEAAKKEAKRLRSDPELSAHLPLHAANPWVY